MNSFYFFLLMLIATPCINYAQSIQTLRLSGQELEKPLNEFMEVYEEKETQKNMKELVKQQFMPFNKLKFDVYKNYWFQFTLSNPTHDTLTIALRLGKEAEVELYQDIFSSQKPLMTGRAILQSKRQLLKFNSTFKIKIQPNVTKKFYLHTLTHPRVNNIHTFTISNFQTYELEYYKNLNNLPQLFRIFFIGAVFLMSMYNLSIILVFWDKNRLFYMLYMLSLGVYYAFRLTQVEELFGEFPIMAAHVGDFMITSTFIFYFRFAQVYLNTKVNYPNWHKIFWGFVIGMMFMSVSSIFFYYVCSINIAVINSIYNIIYIFFCIGDIIFILKVSFKKDIITRYFVIGNAFFFSGGILVALLIIFEPTHASTPNIVMLTQFIVLCEILIFSMGIGMKQYINEQEKKETQRQLIVELEKNKQLQTQTNEQLEIKVLERTKEVGFAINALTKMNDNLENIVVQRTTKLKEQYLKLEKYAHMNSHDLRGPLARILGLCMLIELENLDVNTQDLINKLKFSANELDIVVKQMNHLLEISTEKDIDLMS